MQKRTTSIRDKISRFVTKFHDSYIVDRFSSPGKNACDGVETHCFPFVSHDKKPNPVLEKKETPTPQIPGNVETFKAEKRTNA